MPHEILSRFFLLALAIGTLFLAAAAGEASNTVDSLTQSASIGDPVAGKNKLQSLLCQECHGEDGISVSTFAPHLAGQYAGYIVKQVHDFQTGARDNPTMTMMADTIDETTLQDVAAFYASRSRMKENGSHANMIAKRLFENGDAGRGLPPCIGCHVTKDHDMTTGSGVYPIIAGQRLSYLRDQLYHWKSGERANSPGGLMNRIAETLSDVEIDALAKYISGL